MLETNDERMSKRPVTVHHTWNSLQGTEKAHRWQWGKGWWGGGVLCRQCDPDTITHVRNASGNCLSTTHTYHLLTPQYIRFRNTLTRMISLTATTPEVAMILALFGIKLKIVGMMASAPWSNLFPSTDDRCLQWEMSTGLSPKFLGTVQYIKLFTF